MLGDLDPNAQRKTFGSYGFHGTDALPNGVLSEARLRDGPRLGAFYMPIVRDVVGALTKLRRQFVTHVAILVALCVVQSPAASAAETSRTFEFPRQGVRFDAHFDGARLNGCEHLGDDVYRISVEPENTPVNDSAWYAFKVTAAEAKSITIELVYRDGTHRYQPKISTDRVHWRTLTQREYREIVPHGRARLRLAVAPKPLWVAAQALLTEKEIAEWTDTLGTRSFVGTSTIGRSVAGRKIDMYKIAETDKPRYVFIMSRQHPPEVPGHIGMMAFVDAICENTSLAARYRREFITLCVPLVNPDGVADGNWRHNRRGVDLNRDWGTFEQPETQAVRDALMSRLREKDARPYLFLDFHSTYHDLFYTQSDEQPTFPRDFTRRWLADIQKRMPDERIVRDGAHGSNPYTSRAWAYRALGCPAITVEYGDRSTSEDVRRAAGIAAEEMMRLLLKEVPTRATVPVSTSAE